MQLYSTAVQVPTYQVRYHIRYFRTVYLLKVDFSLLYPDPETNTDPKHCFNSILEIFRLITQKKHSVAKTTCFLGVCGKMAVHVVEEVEAPAAHVAGVRLYHHPTQRRPDYFRNMLLS
jgi:hypothetical protein